MRLDGFRFRYVGPFGAQGVDLSGLEPGLNVVAEHNERGKSSLLAALETVLFLPHTSWKGEAKRLIREDGVPVGEVDFTHEGRPYTLRKRFVKSRQADLIDRHSGDVLATRREAEERLGEMLGFDKASQGPSGLLWVRQGDSMERAEDDGQVASRLESELSTLVGGDRARAYLDRAESELGDLITLKAGRPKAGGPLALAEAALAKTQDDLATARAAQTATHRMGDALARVRDRLGAIEAEGDAAAEAKDLADAKEALNTSRIARSELEAKRDRLIRLELELEAANAKLSSHFESVSRLDQDVLEVQRLEKRKAELADRETRAQSQLTALSEKLAELDTQRGDLIKLERLRTTQDRLSSRNAALQAILSNLEALDAEIAKRADHVAARNVLPAIGREELDRMERLDRQIGRLEDELASLDATLILNLEPDVGATLGDRPLTSGPVRLNARQTLSIEGLATIRLDAPEADHVRNRQAEAREEWTAMQMRFEVSSIQDAHKLFRDRQAMTDDIALIDKLIDQIAPDGRDALIDARQRLESDVERLSEQLQDVPADEALIDTEQLERDFDTLRGEQAAAQARLNETKLELAKTETQLSDLQNRISSAPEQARQDLREAALANLSASTATLGTRVDTARAVFEAAQSRAPVDPDLIQARIDRLTQISRNRTKTLSDLRMEEADLAARRSESFEQRDPDAEVTRLEERVIRLQEDVDRHRQRANALSLLRDTLRESQRTLQDRYTEPVRRELLPLLRQVIDGADVALDETLGAQGLTRAGTDDALDRLSGGTREQIAVLTRLAFARLLSRSGQPCPVILDDALVYADDTRRERMFDVLNYVTRGDNPLQLLYLSCHETNALKLGGHRLRLEPWPED